MKVIGKLLVGAVIAFAAFLLLGNLLSDPAQEKLRQDSINFASMVKKMAKDPKSFDVVELRRSGIGATCLTFRATNSFGAYIQSHAVKTPDNKIQIDGVEGTEQFLWNAYCGDGSGFTISVFNSSL